MSSKEILTVLGIFRILTHYYTCTFNRLSPLVFTLEGSCTLNPVFLPFRVDWLSLGTGVRLC